MQKEVSRAITHGVYVITAKSGDKVNGMTAAWVSQVSIQPLLLMVSIAPSRYTHEVIKEAGYFGINVLSADQKEVARQFGTRSGRKHDKMKETAHSFSTHGSPVISDALAFFECLLIATHEAGDHTLFIGAVESSSMLQPEKEPLVFRWEDYY
jgi:flavin reductase (DIM6/NTAB) family NADH-FMN oxidoreductase RutF